MRIISRTLLMPAVIIAAAITLVVAANRLSTTEVKQSSPGPSASHRPPKVVPIARQYDFRDIVVLNNNEMWAIGYVGTYIPHVWRSTNGGYDWEAKLAPNSELLLDRIDFTDPQSGWAAGAYNRLLHTDDGGKTWKQNIVPTRAEIKSVHFTDRNVGFVAGSTGFTDKKTQESTLGLEILCTKNGGRDWRSCYKDNTSTEVVGFATPGGSIEVAAVDGNFLLRTADGGATWQVVASQNRGFLSVTFAANGVGWAAGHSGLYRSDDQGKTWQRLNNLPAGMAQHKWESIDFEDTQRGIAVGKSGAIVVTDDGGATWSGIESEIEEDLGKVRLGDSTGIILGAKKVYVIDLLGA